METMTFFIALGMVNWKIILGLALGGLVAEPFAAYVCKKLLSRLLMDPVGILLMFITLRL